MGKESLVTPIRATGDFIVTRCHVGGATLDVGVSNEWSREGQFRGTRMRPIECMSVVKGRAALVWTKMTKKSFT